jgi:hypothetical protein
VDTLTVTGMHYSGTLPPCRKLDNELMFVHESHAQMPVILVYSGNDLLRDCTDGKALAQKSFCYGFIAGVWSGAFAEGQVEHNNKPKFLIPEEANLGQLKDVVVKYLNEPARNSEIGCVSPAPLLSIFRPGLNARP